jgi:hypothetical protein
VVSGVPVAAGGAFDVLDAGVVCRPFAFRHGWPV